MVYFRAKAKQPPQNPAGAAFDLMNPEIQITPSAEISVTANTPAAETQARTSTTDMGVVRLSFMSVCSAVSFLFSASSLSILMFYGVAVPPISTAGEVPTTRPLDEMPAV